MFLRAARSITKTKSVSGNFIVKTMICKSNIKRNDYTATQEEESCGASMPMITAQQSTAVATNEVGSPRASPRASSGRHFMSMQMTPNPLIKNSFASPVKAQIIDRSANAIDR